MARTFPSSVAGKKAVLPSALGGDGPRRRILEVALQLFASRGFHGACDSRSGACSRAAAERALRALRLEGTRAGRAGPDRNEFHLEKIRGALLGAGADPADQMSALVRAHARMHATFPHLTIVVNEEMFSLPAELAAPGVALRGQSTALILEVVQRGVAMGRFSASHPMTAAAAIGAIGLRIPYWYEPAPDLDIERLADLQADLALRMLGVTPDGDRR